MNKYSVYDPFALDEECRNALPPLCVDCVQSAIHLLYRMKYVSLRRYKVKSYAASEDAS